jgi:uncharacterized protein (DUF885 family)
MLTMAALGIGGALLATPVALLAQGATNEKNTETRSGDEATRRFRVYLEEDWKRWMVEYPELATAAGFPGQNRRWSDDSPAGIEARKKHLHESAAALKGFSRDSLPRAEQLNFDLYSDLLSTAEEGLQYGDDPLPFRNVVPQNNWMSINQMGGVQQSAAETISTLPNRSVADYEDILARLEGLPTYVEQQQALLQEGLKRGYTPPRLMLRDVPKQIADLIPADPMASALLEPFKNFPWKSPSTIAPG